MLKVFWGYFRAVILALIIGMAIVLSAEIEKVPDGSMAPVISPDDFVFINKAVYIYSDPKTGDIVALKNNLHTNSGGGSLFTSRIAGVGGDVITLPGGEKEVVKAGYVYLVSAEDETAETAAASGAEYAESEAEESSIFRAAPDETAEIETAGKGVATGRLDSRNSAVGQIAVTDIIGRIEFVVWPLQHAGQID